MAISSNRGVTDNNSSRMAVGMDSSSNNKIIVVMLLNIDASGYYVLHWGPSDSLVEGYC